MVLLRILSDQKLWGDSPSSDPSFVYFSFLCIFFTVYDAAVIGAGINGSWAALNLAKRGKKVVLIEQVVN